MKTIRTKSGDEYSVDDDDYELLSKYKWSTSHQSGLNYAQCRIAMHRLVMDFPKDMIVDHVNGDTQDNRKENLRVCTQTQNMFNRKSHKNSLTGYKGVSWHKVRKKWRVQISINGKPKTKGYFDCLLEAAKEYDRLAIVHFGEYARLNFPKP